MAAEKNTAGYVVEKSADGVTFKKVADVAAKFNNGMAAGYSWYDANALSGNNYYRIIMRDVSGIEKYSKVAVVKTGDGKSSIVAYPNPVRDHVVSLQFINQPKARYKIQLFNSLGQEAFARTISHPGGSATQTVPLTPALSKGSYRLVVSNKDKQTVLQIICN